MKCRDDCHQYELDNFEGAGQRHQILLFINKRLANPIEDGKTLVTVHDGTTNEEVLKCLIHRTGELNKKFPCRENSIAITKMEEALLWFEKRTNDRKNRGVEGKHQA